MSSADNCRWLASSAAIGVDAPEVGGNRVADRGATGGRVDSAGLCSGDQEEFETRGLSVPVCYALTRKLSLANYLRLFVCSVRDWLYGVRNTEPENESEPQTEAERLRVIYHMITVSEEEGGAGISVDHGEWKNVDAIFSLHDEEANSRCLREWSQKTFLSTEDLDRIRGQFGESVCDCFKAFYCTC